MDRPDQRIANESGNEQGCEHIKDQVVDLIARNAFDHAGVMQVVDDHYLLKH
jgi:hypothetical protein